MGTTSKKRPAAALKKREMQVLLLICKEHTNVRIAKQLKLNVRSVERIRGRVYKKTKTDSALQLYRYALINKLIKLK